MSDVLVTGGTGTLGRLVVSRLLDEGRTVRVLTRRPPPSSEPRGATYRTGDLRDVAGLAGALDGVATVVHCASDPRRAQDVDVSGTAALVEAMRVVGVGHLVYVSIVGVDRIPVTYYRAKRAAEELVERSDVGWTVQRATQFHQLVDALLTRVSRSPVLPVPRALRLQPVAPGDLASRLTRHVADGPAGRAPDFGGPDVHPAAHIVDSWLAAHATRRLLVPAPLPGRLGRAYRDGANLAVDHPDGRETWQQYLQQRTGSPRGPEPGPTEPGGAGVGGGS